MSEIRRPSIDRTGERLLKALDCLLIENFTIQDKTLLEKLLSSLHSADILLKTIPLDTHYKWFASVLDINQRQKSISKNSSIHLYAFALKYLAILIKSNDSLVALIESHILQTLINRLDIASNLKESSIFNAYMTLLQALNSHKQGLEYVFQEGLWKHILFAINGLIIPTKYVEIQSSQYIADLIYKSFEHKLAHYSEPLLIEIFFKVGSVDNLIANKKCKEFAAYNVYVKTLILTLEKFIGTNYEMDACENIVFKYSLSNILEDIQKILNVTPILLKNYIMLHLLFDCFTLWNHSDMNCILKSIFSHMNIPKDVQSYKQINNLYIQTIIYAHKSNTQLVINTVFEKELIIGQLIPLNKCIGWLKYSKNLNFDSCIVETKCILNYCNEYDPMVYEMAVSSVLNVLEIVPILKQESLDYLVTFFSELTDKFLYSDNWIEEDEIYVTMNIKFSEILSYVFICWTKVLEHKSFNSNVTQDTLLVPLVHRHSQFFDKKSHSSALLQNGFNLITMALNKRIHETIQYTDNLTGFDKLCSTLNNFLLDTRPEIRDSCLQCITSIIISSKYTSGHFIINLILKNKLSVSVLNTLKCDNDLFVRAKALECLEKMVSVLDIWETSLKESDLIFHCLNLMQCESEGIIRRQIVKLITALIIHDELSVTLFDEICIVMVNISIRDPLWEVKTFAYEFWDAVIQKFIGKSCALNDKEKLKDNLVKLSETGCLHVLYSALKEEYDLVVQKKAIDLTKAFLVSISSINKSEFNFELKNLSVNCLSSIDKNLESCTGSKQKKSRQIDSVDRVLNSITISSDCELLPSLKTFNSTNIYPVDICLHQKTDTYMSVNDFLNFASSYDFNDCEVKTQWVISTRSGLDSMLHDIIGQSQNCFIEGADLIDCH